MNRLINTLNLFTLALLLSISSAKAESRDNLIKQANEFSALVNAKEYTKVAFKLNPMIVITMGGISQATDAIKQGFSALDSGSNSFKGLTFREPNQIISIENDLVAIIPSETVFKVRKKIRKA